MKLLISRSIFTDEKRLIYYEMNTGDPPLERISNGCDFLRRKVYLCIYRVIFNLVFCFFNLNNSRINHIIWYNPPYSLFFYSVSGTDDPFLLLPECIRFFYSGNLPNYIKLRWYTLGIIRVIVYSQYFTVPYRWYTNPCLSCQVGHTWIGVVTFVNWHRTQSRRYEVYTKKLRRRVGICILTDEIVGPCEIVGSCKKETSYFVLVTVDYSIRSTFGGTRGLPFYFPLFSMCGTFLCLKFETGNSPPKVVRGLEHRWDP